MRKFNVNVNGISYRVEIEETAAFAEPPVQMTPVAPVAPTPAVNVPATASAGTKAQPVAAAPAPVAAPTNGTKLESPMPGTVVKIVAQNGATVKKGDVILMLESMKMENEIVANANGVVTVVAVVGSNVNAGDLLAVIA
ncbi:MAG: biotin/lipoyl-binding protein [Christensenellaceae bacterium]|jgi:glutaconyl-CoA decarboxylase|nr:biotin/lipoyl-binding protein [Christensenellaceae bacterium]